MNDDLPTISTSEALRQVNDLAEEARRYIRDNTPEKAEAYSRVTAAQIEAIAHLAELAE